MHPRRIRCALIAAIVLVVPSPGYAQEAGKSGLVLGTGSIGVIWHAANSMAVRPDFSFSWSSTEGETSTNTSTQLTIGVSGLFYVARIDELRLYLSPRVAYARSRSTSEFTVSPGTTTSTGTAPGFQASGVFGAQYLIHRRFAVYGEAGGVYATTTAKSDATSPSGQQQHSEQTGRAWATKATVGVILYF